jgi:hypothetical protein
VAIKTAIFLAVSLQISAAVHLAKPGDALQGKVDALQPGDTLKFAAGSYTQPIIVRTSQVQLRGDGKAEFCGLRKLAVEWTRIGETYKATVDHPVRQLFLNGELLTPARWPNMGFAERWDNSKWRAAGKGSRYGTMVDPALAEPGLDFSGCVAILNIGSWQTFRRVISSHRGGRFTYSTASNPRLHESNHPVGMDRYCIYGRAALDAPGEWYFDAAESALYVIPPVGVDLASATVESKVLSEAIVVDGAQGLALSGFKFRGTTLRLRNTKDCELRNLRLDFPSAIANPFGPNLPYAGEQWNARKWFGESSVDALTEFGGDRLLVRDVQLRYSEGPAITVIGKEPLIENCEFRDIDWHGLDYGFGIDLLATTRPKVRYVTLAYAGGSEGLRLPNHSPSLVEYCHLHHCGLRQSDGAIIQTSMPDCRGTEIRYNWIHDHNAFHWGGNGIRGDDGSRGLDVHHNVVWNCSEKGIVLKGDSHHVHHNICFDNATIDILLPRSRLPGKDKELKEQNRHSFAHDNRGKVQGNWRWEPPALPYAKTRDNQPAAKAFPKGLNWQAGFGKMP